MERPRARSTASLLLLLLLTLLPASVARAGAWVPEPGSGYAKLWTKGLLGFGYHDGDDNTIDYGSYYELALATYGELGLLPSLAATWQLDLVRAAFLEDPATGDREGHATIGDPRLGLRLALLKHGPWALAVEAGGLAPLANDDALQPFVYADESVAGVLRLGAGVWEANAGLSLGLGLGRYYAQAGAGYVLRSDGFDDVVQFRLEGGASFGEDWAARARVTGNLPIEAEDAPYIENPAGVGNGVSYAGLALEVDYALSPGWMIGLTAEGGLFAIRRQTGGPVLSIYAAHDF